MLNVVAIQGRICGEIELRHTTNDIPVTSFTIAQDIGFGDKKTAHFFDCVAWRNAALHIEKYFKKGNMIAVDGTLQTRSYTDKNGNNRKAVEIVVNNAHFCESKGAAPAEKSQDKPFPSGNEDFEEVGSEEELPFSEN